MISTPHKYYLSDQIEKNAMGGTCRTYGGEERWIQGFGGETWGKETTWETQAWMGGYYENGSLGSGMWGHGLDRAGWEEG